MTLSADERRSPCLPSLGPSFRERGFGATSGDAWD